MHDIRLYTKHGALTILLCDTVLLLDGDLLLESRHFLLYQPVLLLPSQGCLLQCPGLLLLGLDAYETLGNFFRVCHGMQCSPCTGEHALTLLHLLRRGPKRRLLCLEVAQLGCARLAWGEVS